jgi:hypothetical protein
LSIAPPFVALKLTSVVKKAKAVKLLVFIDLRKSPGVRIGKEIVERESGIFFQKAASQPSHFRISSYVARNICVDVGCWRKPSDCLLQFLKFIVKCHPRVIEIVSTGHIKAVHSRVSQLGAAPPRAADRMEAMPMEARDNVGGRWSDEGEPH